MENTQSGHPHDATWPSPEERKRQHGTRKNTDGGGSPNKAAAGRPPAGESGVAHGETTIWQRPEDGAPSFEYGPARSQERQSTLMPPETTSRPEPRPAPKSSFLEQPRVMHAAPSPDNALSESRVAEEEPQQPSGPEESDELRKAVEQAYEVHQPERSNSRPAAAPDIPPPLESNPQWLESYTKSQVRGYNPDIPPHVQRPYFWNEPEVSKPDEKQYDVLPPVLPSQEEKPAPGETDSHVPSIDPSLAQAVNPNLNPAAEVPYVRPGPPVEHQETAEAANGQDPFTRRPLVEPAAPETPRAESQEVPGATMEFPTPTWAAKKEQTVPMANSAEVLPSSTPELDERTHNMEVELAKTIYIDGLSIYDMFVGRQIDADGLHKVVTEYISGGDVKKVALQEIARQQIRFERDPQLRSAPLTQPLSQSAALNQPELPPLPDVQPPAATAKPISHSVAERTDRFVDMTQGASERMQDLLQRPDMGNMLSYAAIIAIYAAIIIIILV